MNHGRHPCKPPFPPFVAPRPRHCSRCSVRPAAERLAAAAAAAARSAASSGGGAAAAASSMPLAAGAWGRVRATIFKASKLASAAATLARGGAGGAAAVAADAAASAAAAAMGGGGSGGAAAAATRGWLAGGAGWGPAWLRQALCYCHELGGVGVADVSVLGWVNVVNGLYITRPC